MSLTPASCGTAGRRRPCCKFLASRRSGRMAPSERPASWFPARQSDTAGSQAGDNARPAFFFANSVVSRDGTDSRCVYQPPVFRQNTCLPASMQARECMGRKCGTSHSSTTSTPTSEAVLAQQSNPEKQCSRSTTTRFGSSLFTRSQQLSTRSSKISAGGRDFECWDRPPAHWPRRAARDRRNRLGPSFQDVTSGGEAWRAWPGRCQRPGGCPPRATPLCFKNARRVCCFTSGLLPDCALQSKLVRAFIFHSLAFRGVNRLLLLLDDQVPDVSTVVNPSGKQPGLIPDSAQASVGKALPAVNGPQGFRLALSLWQVRSPIDTIKTATFRWSLAGVGVSENALSPGSLPASDTTISHTTRGKISESVN